MTLFEEKKQCLFLFVNMKTWILCSATR